MKRYSLGIIQTHATQFDGPLFNQIAKHPDIVLTVYYTSPDEETPFDKEIGLKPAWDNISDAGYNCRRRKRGFLNAFRFVWQVVNAGHDMVVVSGYFPLYHLFIAVCARLKGVRLGLRSDATLRTYRSGVKSIVKRLLMPWIMKLYSVGYPTGSLAGKYLVHYGFPENRLFRFPYAVDNHYLEARYRRYRARRERLRNIFGIGLDSFVVLGVLKLVEREDPMTLLLGFDKLRKTYPMAHLVLVGDGPMKKELETTFREKNIPNVHFPGYVVYSRLASFYAIADVFVHPPLREPWGVSVNEAMACGLPVVLADTVGSHVDLVKPGKTGFVFEKENAESLAKCLVELNSDRERCQSMGEQARRLIADWSYDCIVESLLSALRAAAPKLGAWENNSKRSRNGSG